MSESDLRFFQEISAGNLVTFHNMPQVRVKMVDQQESLDFEVHGRFLVTDEQGNVLRDDFETETRWRARVDAFTPPTYQYLLFVIEVFQEPDAQAITEDLLKRGFQAWHKSFGYSVQKDGIEQLFQNYRHRVFIGPVVSKQKARIIQTQLLGVYHAQILKIPYRQARGILEIVDLQMVKSLKGTGFIRMQPKSSEGRITIHGIHNMNKLMPYTFNHPVEFHITENGKLFLVSALEVEEYITGLVTAAFKPEYPTEFLKAMAVSYRSSVLANLGMNHINESYDYCRAEHCFEFEWRDELHPKLKAVLEATSGKFLLQNDILCDAQQHLICGGHTEHIDIMMNRDTRNSITGRYDILKEKTEFPPSLFRQVDAENWIQTRPAVLCNLRGKALEQEYENFRHYFRWVVEYNRQELDAIVRKKIEEDIGTIFDIVPLLRGGSGRLLEVEVLGSHRNVHLIGDHEIRSCLAEKMLPSSCFVIETEPDVDGSPAQFIFSGAGKGHGVGMCQIGAIAMAHEGQDFLAILRHYFGQVELVDRLPVKQAE